MPACCAYLDRFVAKMAHCLWCALGIEGLDKKENAGTIRWGIFFIFLAIFLRLFFWIYTHRVWEDALITCLHAENFVRGIGLTHYRTGQPPLHGFTSPLSVLVPLMGDFIHLGFGIEFIKLVGAFCSGLTLCYALGICIHPKTRLPLPAAVLVMGYLACEHHQILWGMSGMETQIVVAILFMSIYYTLAWKPLALEPNTSKGVIKNDGSFQSATARTIPVACGRWTALGISLGLCMLARPDFAFWTVIVGCYILLKDYRQFPKIVAVALAVYLPWIIFTTLYYGSPIPNTIYAKGLGYHIWWQESHLTFADVKREMLDRVVATYLPNTLFQALGPSFAGHGTGFHAIIPDKGIIANTMLFLAFLGVLRIFIKRIWLLLPAVFFVALYSLYYIFLVPYVFGWYLVPLIAVTLLLSAHGLTFLADLPACRHHRTLLLSAFTTLYLLLIAGILPITFSTEKDIQEHIENKVRKPLAQYLNKVMGPDESIGCEPLGYISYYSQRTVYDWPGLANRAVVEYSRNHPDARTMNDMFEHFRPDYLVLRMYEYSYLKEHKGGWIDRDYHIIKQYQIAPEVENTIALAAYNPDRYFLLLKKND